MAILSRKKKSNSRFTRDEFIKMYKEVHSEESCIEPTGWDLAMKKYDKWGIIKSKGESERENKL